MVSTECAVAVPHLNFYEKLEKLVTTIFIIIAGKMALHCQFDSATAEKCIWMHLLVRLNDAIKKYNINFEKNISKKNFNVPNNVSALKWHNLLWEYLWNRKKVVCGFGSILENMLMKVINFLWNLENWLIFFI